MSSGNHTHTKHNKQKPTTHVGNGNIALMHITQLTKVASIHLAMFGVIVQSSPINVLLVTLVSSSKQMLSFIIEGDALNKTLTRRCHEFIRSTGITM